MRDFTFFLQCFGKDPTTSFTSEGISCLNADYNDNLLVNTQDFTFFIQKYSQGRPGPSGLACAKLDHGSPNLTSRQPCFFDPTPND